MKLAFRSLLVGLVLLPLGARAQNLLVNPHFDGNATGWNLNGPTPSYDATLDAGGGAPGSGSVHDTYSGATGTATSDVSQCITGIVAGTTYGFGASVYAASAQQVGATPSTRVSIQFYSTPDCSGSMLSTTLFTNYVTPPLDTWSLQSGSGAAPATAASAFILLWIGETGGGTATLNYDNAFFGVGLTPATLTRFRAD